jgi:lactoylglutathione lyase
MLHAVYRVGDMDKYIKYMQDCFGMKLLRYRDMKEDKYINAFLGYGSEKTNFALEYVVCLQVQFFVGFPLLMFAFCTRFCRLTYNYGREEYDIGTGFGHFGLAVNDVYATAGEVKSKGGIVSREPGPVKGGKTNIAFVKDPTGYSWELIERQGEIPEPIAQVMLRVGDLDKSIKFYTEALGMKLLRTRENPEYKYTLAFLGYGDEQSNTVFELTYNWGKDSSNYDKGDAYAQVAISTKDVFKTADQIRSAGGTITREPGPVPGIGTKIGKVQSVLYFGFYLLNDANSKV